MMSTLRREDPLAREKVLKNVSKTRLVFTNANALASMVPWVPETFLARFSGFFSRLRPAAEDVSAFGQQRKFPPHATKTSGTQGTSTGVARSS